MSEHFDDNASSDDIEIEGIDLKIDLEKDLEEIREEIERGTVRGLGDIHRLGAQNRAEERLLQSAKIMLSPDQFEESVMQNKSAVEVFAQIEQNVTLKNAVVEMNLAVQQQREQEEAQEVQQEKTEKPLSMKDMTEIQGVTNKLEEIARETKIFADIEIEEVDGEELSTPDATPKNHAHEAEKQEGPDMSFYQNMKTKK